MKKLHLVDCRTIVTFVLVAALISGCSKAKPAPPRTVPVVAGSAEQKNIPLQIRTIGNVEPYNSVSIKALVSGEVAGVYFREGQDVKNALQDRSASYESALGRRKLPCP
jgi:multidrug efflux system membrane fusion protein